MPWVLSSERVAEEREQLLQERIACESRRDDAVRAAGEQYEGEVRSIEERLSFLAVLEAEGAKLGEATKTDSEQNGGVPDPRQVGLPLDSKEAPKKSAAQNGPLTQKSMVYRAVRAHPSGIDRQGIVHYVKGAYKAEIPANQVTTYLWRLTGDHLVRVEGRTWFPVREGHSRH